MSSIVIVGFSADDKVPGDYRETKYGQGRVSIGSLPVRLVVTGNKITAGSATADADILPVYSSDDADTLAGAGSEGAFQCYAALDIDGVSLFYAPVAEAGGAAAATLTITIGGSWATSAIGQLAVYLAGKRFEITVTGTDTTTTVAAALASKINEDSRLFCSASPASAVVTLTTKSKGARANDWICRKDIAGVPTGLTCALAGGTALTGGMVPFSGGSGADDVTNVLALLKTDTFDFLAPAQNDATNAALIKTHLSTVAAPTIKQLEHAVYAKTRSQSTAASFAQTTLNDFRSTVVWFENCEWAPSAVGAQIASLRSVVVGDNPNYKFDDCLMPTIPAQSQRADRPQHSALKSALNSGLMPLRTNTDATVAIVRAIQCHSLNGSSADYRALDWGDVDVPDRISKQLGARWQSESTVDTNPYVGPDPGSGEPAAPEGVMTPASWNASVYEELKDAESANWIMAVDANLPLSEYNVSRKCIMSAVKTIVRPINHAIGISTRQQAA